LVGHVPPGLCGGLVVGLEKGLSDRGGDHRVLAFGHMGERVAHPVDAGAVEKVLCP
jgi:hypothetical protein